MIDRNLFYIFLYLWIALAIVVFFVLLKTVAPYGRHVRTGWGPKINTRAGWIVMEIPALLVFALFFLIAGQNKSPVSWLFFVLWMFHYFNRSLIFPFRLKTGHKKVPVLIVLSAILFNLVNGFFNGYYLGLLAPAYPGSWFLDIRFIFGIFLFFTGLIINWHADSVLIGLRKSQKSRKFTPICHCEESSTKQSPVVSTKRREKIASSKTPRNDGKGYKDNGKYTIPQPGLFRYITCPNYFGEIVEWLGFAIMAWSLPAFSFFVWTSANLVPRALANHKWYHERFDNYPTSRKAIFPFVL